MRAPLRLPFLVQVLILLSVTVFAVQVMTVVLIGVLPRPRPIVFRAADVAAALEPGAAQAGLDVRLLRTEQASAPAPALQDRIEAPITRRVLAQLLSAPEDGIWFSGGGGRPGAAMQNGGLGSLFAPPPRPTFRRTRPQSPQALSPEARQKLDANWPIYGPFTAAMHQADGRWTVVQTRPEPFPNANQRRIGLWLFACILLVIPIAYVFARRITAPILSFAQAAEALGRDPGGAPASVDGPAEIARAANAFNLMQARVRHLIEDRTAMFGAISHDLKTPLARIRFRVERDPVGARQAILQDLRQMEEMLSQVLAFIRGSEPKERAPLELRSVVECVVDGALPPGAVHLEDGEPLYVEGDPLDLTRLFANLVDNAIKYGERATIRLDATDGQARVEISDEGPGLAQGEIEKVFAPFYRADGARNQGRSGVGLGLSVARSIARAHGGDVDLTTGSDSGGLTAIVTLPLQSLPEAAPESQD
ncbi:MAG TPA: HAMP domain-containing sensor histidine kinase [Caulobacteraceae bacterium]|nr:HAMP domain-containing sensor histidine kinase [Caulobacteraceae bacterium]